MAEGVVRDVKGLFQSRDSLFNDYLYATDAVDLGINILTSRIRKKQISKSEARETAKILAEDIDTNIGEHPLRFRSWNLAKKTARLLKKDVYTSVDASIGYHAELPESLHRKYPDEEGKVFDYEQVKPLGDRTITQPGIKLSERAKLIYKAKDLAAYVDLNGEKTQPISISNERQKIPVVQTDLPVNNNYHYYKKNAVIAHLAGLASILTGCVLENQGVIDPDTSYYLISGGLCAAIGIPYLAHAANLITEKKSKPQIKPESPKRSYAGTRIAAGLITLAGMVGLFSGKYREQEVLPPHKAVHALDYCSGGILFPNDLGEIKR